MWGVITVGTVGGQWGSRRGQAGPGEGRLGSGASGGEEDKSVTTLC